MANPLAPFEAVVVEAVAADHDVPVESLERLLARHQRLFREFPDLTVADMVYEWRSSLPGDPLVAREGDTYYLDAPAHAWADLAGRLDLDEADEAALRAVHGRQFAADRGDAPDGALVLVAESASHG